MSASQLDAFFAASPIVLDLNGDGVRTTSAANGVNFDLNGTGTVNKVGWVDATDGLLVMDRNGDGKINDGTELFGAATKDANGNRVGNGYNAMALEDTNHDLKLDTNDAHFKDLRVWVDANQDGKTDDGELKTLAELGITSLDLSAQSGTEVDNGNLLGMVGSYTATDGSEQAMADVWFAKQAAATPTLTDLLADAGESLLADDRAQVASTDTGRVTNMAISAQQRLSLEEELLRNQQPLL
jgi:hypothetical protein